MENYAEVKDRLQVTKEKPRVTYMVRCRCLCREGNPGPSTQRTYAVGLLERGLAQDFPPERTVNCGRKWMEMDQLHSTCSTS